MIELSKRSTSQGGCNCCHKSTFVDGPRYPYKETLHVRFSFGGLGTVVRLCSECVTELRTKLQDAEKQK